MEINGVWNNDYTEWPRVSILILIVRACTLNVFKNRSHVNCLHKLCIVRVHSLETRYFIRKLPIFLSTSKKLYFLNNDVIFQIHSFLRIHLARTFISNLCISQSLNFPWFMQTINGHWLFISGRNGPPKYSSSYTNYHRHFIYVHVDEIYLDINNKLRNKSL